MLYVCHVLYAVLYVRVSCFVVHGCAVSRRYIHICNCNMFSVVNVYHDHLKFCVVYINVGRYVGCSECNVVSHECNEPTSCGNTIRDRSKVQHKQLRDAREWLKCGSSVAQGGSGWLGLY